MQEDKVELERMDWEHVKESAKQMIRSSKLQIINAEFMLRSALNELKKYPEVKKSAQKIVEEA
jgi:hypothetical protein